METAFIYMALFDAAGIFQWVVDNASYWLVFLLMAVESSFIPFPSEVIVPPAAYIAVTTGKMSVYGVCLAATAGALVGALFNYYLSLWLGRPIIYAFANSRFGHACLIDKDKVERAEVYFDKHGAASTFIGRLVPVIRQLISIPAGLARMNIGVFMIFTTLGALVWNIALTAIGWWLGRTVPIDKLYDAVERYNGYLTVIGIIIGAVAAAFILYNAFARKKVTRHS